MSIKYAEVLPENVKSSYKENENIDFVLAFEGEQLMLNNISIQGDFFLSVDGTNIQAEAGTNRIGIDHRIGAHSFISGITTTLQNSNLGVIENISEYPRMVRMARDGNVSNNQLLSSQYVCELASPDNRITERLCKARCLKEYGSDETASLAYLTARGQIIDFPLRPNSADTAVLPNFSIKPVMALNKAVGNNKMLDYSQSGAVRITITLERNLNAVFGVDATGNSSYELRNLKLCYMSKKSCPPAAPQPVKMRTTLGLKNSLLSAQANVSSKVPAVCDSVSISYMLSSHEANASFSNVDLEMPPNLSKIDYMFNDSFNQYYQFEIDNKPEMVQQGLASLANIDPSNSDNNATLNLMSANKAFVVGLNWNVLTDLSQTKFNINQSTDISNTAPYLMFLYFHSMVQIN